MKSRQPCLLVEMRRTRATSTGSIALLLALFACAGHIETQDQDGPATSPNAARPAAANGTSSAVSSDTGSSGTAVGNTGASPPAPSPAAVAPAPASGEATARPAPASSAAAGGPAASAPMPEALRFEQDIWPIFNSKCGPCHVTQREGGHNVGSEDLDIALEAAVSRKDDILKEIRNRDMPPRCSRANAPEADCVTDAELDEISEWYAEGSPP